jgi:riboflavin synthase
MDRIMFTGIVEEVGKIVAAPPGRLTVAASKTLERIGPGDSICVNGVCLTVTSLTPNSFTFDVMPETARRSNLGRLRPGDPVNLERPLTLGAWVGGHLVQGHVDATGRFAARRSEGGALLFSFEAPAEVLYYVVEKCFIAVDGISLTVAGRDSRSFSVSVVGFTQEHTNLAGMRVGDTVNLEVDIVAKYVSQFNRLQGSGVTVEFLREHGFPAG